MGNHTLSHFFTFLLDCGDQLHDAAAGFLEHRNGLRSGMRDVVVAVRIDRICRMGSGQVGADVQGLLDAPGGIVVLHSLLGIVTEVEKSA